MATSCHLHSKRMNDRDVLRAGQVRTPATPAIVITRSDNVASPVHRPKPISFDLIWRASDAEELMVRVHLSSQQSNSIVQLHRWLEQRKAAPPGEAVAVNSVGLTQDLNRGAIFGYCCRVFTRLAVRHARIQVATGRPIRTSHEQVSATQAATDTIDVHTGPGGPTRQCELGSCRRHALDRDATSGFHIRTSRATVPARPVSSAECLNDTRVTIAIVSGATFHANRNLGSIAESKEGRQFAYHRWSGIDVVRSVARQRPRAGECFGTGRCFLSAQPHYGERYRV